MWNKEGRAREPHRRAAQANVWAMTRLGTRAAQSTDGRYVLASQILMVDIL